MAEGNTASGSTFGVFMASSSGVTGRHPTSSWAKAVKQESSVKTKMAANKPARDGYFILTSMTLKKLTVLINYDLVARRSLLSFHGEINKNLAYAAKPAKQCHFFAAAKHWPRFARPEPRTSVGCDVLATLTRLLCQNGGTLKVECIEH